MIDRKTALICAGLIALMFAVALWRILSPEDWALQTAGNGPPLPPPLLLLIFPAASALVVGSLYLTGLRASADDSKVQPWRRWGRLLSLGYCSGLSLLQGVLVARSFDLQPPPALVTTLAVLMMILALLAINQMPKLPWFERRFSPGGELGPVYGPRFMRILSRALIVFLIASFAFSFAVPGTQGTRVVLVATALFVLWSIVWRIRLGHKRRLEQSAHG